MEEDAEAVVLSRDITRYRLLLANCTDEEARLALADLLNENQERLNALLCSEEN
jgi:hypothetical protein